jgi:hypothetical protein
MDPARLDRLNANRQIGCRQCQQHHGWYLHYSHSSPAPAFIHCCLPTIFRSEKAAIRGQVQSLDILFLVISGEFSPIRFCLQVPTRNISLCINGVSNAEVPQQRAIGVAGSFRARDSIA